MRTCVLWLAVLVAAPVVASAPPASTAPREEVPAPGAPAADPCRDAAAPTATASAERGAPQTRAYNQNSCRSNTTKQPSKAAPPSPVEPPTETSVPERRD